MKHYRDVEPRPPVPLLPALMRRRPRAYAEWKALQRWQKLPEWEEAPPGYLLRLAREQAGFTQQTLADRLGCSQQAIAQAERAASNPTIALLRQWAAATNHRLLTSLEPLAGTAWEG